VKNFVSEKANYPLRSQKVWCSVYCSTLPNLSYLSPPSAMLGYTIYWNRRNWKNFWQTPSGYPQWPFTLAVTIY